MNENTKTRQFLKSVRFSTLSTDSCQNAELLNYSAFLGLPNEAGFLGEHVSEKPKYKSYLLSHWLRNIQC